MADKEERDLTAEPTPLQPSKYQPRYANSYAIVIGIDTYSDPKLQPLGKAEEDARSIRDVLSSEPYNFKVELLLGQQATKKAITSALKKIINTSQADDRVIFYFAGHGYPQKNKRGVEIGYLACADTDPTDPFDGLEYAEVLKLIDNADAKHIAFILDACFSGIVLGLTRYTPMQASTQEYLLHTAYQVLTAGAVEVVSDARSMTGELVKVLKEGLTGHTGALTFNHLGQHIHDVIHNQSKGRQSPVFGFLEGSSKGQMVLVTPSLYDSLPKTLRLGLTNQDPDMRCLAVTAAEKYLTDPDLGETVRQVLEEMQTEDEDREVRRCVKEALRHAPKEEIQKPEPKTTKPAGKSTEPVGIKPEPQVIKPSEKKTEVIPEPVEIKPEPQVIKPLEKKTEVITGHGESKHEPGKEEQQKSPAHDPILDILPPPFSWCDIPAGKVTLEEKAGTFEVKPFKMAKYPITYAQFQVFLDAKDGFKDDRCWRGLAHQEKRAGKQTWKVANHPRETVSWYAAVAFCNWLSQRVGYEIRLPTEWEWQWAAQGPDGRQYPWGKEFLKGYANIDERRIRGGDFSLQQTTPVDRYPQGASPFGVLDMAGNVWEWCLNEYDTPANIATTGNALRAQRGGSFSDYARLWQCKFRFNREPGNRYGLIGFRIVFSPFFYPNSGL